ncbi:MAG: hypothetical protein QXG39_00830 [Candidatus Aenigmatarchaeota archaeon]
MIRVDVFIDRSNQNRLKFDIDDWPHHIDLNILYSEHRKTFAVWTGEVVKEIEEEIKMALS